MSSVGADQRVETQPLLSEAGEGQSPGRALNASPPSPSMNTTATFGKTAFTPNETGFGFGSTPGTATDRMEAGASPPPNTPAHVSNHSLDFNAGDFETSPERTTSAGGHAASAQGTTPDAKSPTWAAPNTEPRPDASYANAVPSKSDFEPVLPSKRRVQTSLTKNPQHSKLLEELLSREPASKVSPPILDAAGPRGDSPTLLDQTPTRVNPFEAPSATILTRENAISAPKTARNFTVETVKTGVLTLGALAISALSYSLYDQCTRPDLGDRSVTWCMAEEATAGFNW